MTYDDCVHIHACRLQKINCKNQFGKTLVMHCNEHCTAYCKDDGDCYITVDKALRYARDGASSIRSGYDEYDIYCRCDLPCSTLKDIIDEKEGN